MAEYRAAAEALHRLFSELPEHVLDLRYRDQYSRVGDEIRGCFWRIADHIDLDRAELEAVMDDGVDDARYYNWAELPAHPRVRYAQLLALFENPARFIPAEEAEAADKIFSDLLEYAQKLFSRFSG
jgi:hypothetical protein